MRKIGEFLLARNGHAAFVAFIFTLLVLVGIPLGFVALIVVGLVTLCRGPRSGLFILVWVGLPAAALLYLRRYGVLDILFLRCALVWLSAYILRRLGSWSWVFEIGALLGVLIVAGVHFAFPDVNSWWTAHITKYLDEVNSVTSWRLTATQSHEFIKIVTPMATGIAAFVVLFGTWLMLFLARWWQSVLFYPGRARDEFIEFRNRIVVAVIAVLGLAAYLLKQPILVDIFPVLLFPLMMGGLSFLHYIAVMKKGFFIVVILCYLGLLLLPFIVVAILALIGFSDACINYRKFFKLEEGMT